MTEESAERINFVFDSVFERCIAFKDSMWELNFQPTLITGQENSTLALTSAHNQASKMASMRVKYLLDRL